MSISLRKSYNILVTEEMSNGMLNRSYTNQRINHNCLRFGKYDYGRYYGLYLAMCGYVLEISKRINRESYCS